MAIISMCHFELLKTKAKYYYFYTKTKHILEITQAFLDHVYFPNCICIHTCKYYIKTLRLIIAKYL